MSPMPDEPSFDNGQEQPAKSMDEPVRERTPAEQADFNARVDAEAMRLKHEAEAEEVNRVAAERHKQERDARDEVAMKADASDAERQARAEKLAAYASHPSVRLAGIQKDMADRRNLDINARIGVLHQAMARLIQVIMEHTPPAPPHPDAEEQHVDSGERREDA